MRVAIVGTGYVGIVTGVCLAHRGHDVICVDLDRSKVDRINAGEAPIHEVGLPERLKSVAGRRLRATTDLKAAVAASEVTLIAVGTPFAGGAIDLQFIEQSARDIGRALRGTTDYHVVVVRSTVVPGTTEGLVRRALEEESGRQSGAGFGLGMNPEFLTEGQAIEDFESQDRIVIGGIDARSCAAIDALYEGFDGVPRVQANPATAEMIKYASNALLATAISFTNEMANLAGTLGNIDIVNVMRGVHLSRYLTRAEPGKAPWTAPLANFLMAGCGYGGSCLPKDVKALASAGASVGSPMRLLETVEAINTAQPARLVALLRDEMPDLKGRRVTVLGLAFKQDTDDVRETPARPVVEQLLAAGAAVTVYDPIAGGQAETLFGKGRVQVAGSLQASLAEAEAVILITRWAEFERVPQLLAGRSPAPLLVDGRRMIEPGAVSRYAGIGLGAA
jgi:UDPglucose 6-dehydrogenase/GDP-mannose 6-dehydrogenase